MNIDVQRITAQGDKPLTRADVEGLLHKVGSSNKLNLSGRNMAGIDLAKFRLTGTDLSGADLSGADLSGAMLIAANLSFADLSFANLSLANLSLAKLSRAKLSGAKLSGAIMSEFEKEQLRNRGAIGLDDPYMETADSTTVLHIRITEDPLPAQSLTTIMSSLTELFTKFWLIQQGRFPDLVEYALTHDARFTKEANVVITEIKHSSPFEFKFDVSLNPETGARAVQILSDMKKLEAERKEEARLKNKALEEEIEHKRLELQILLADKAVDRQIKVEEANLKSQEAYIKIQNELTALEERRLKLRREAAEFELDFINRALDTAQKLVDVFYPSADADQRAIGARILLNNLLQVNGIEQLDFILSLPK